MRGGCSDSRLAGKGFIQETEGDHSLSGACLARNPTARGFAGAVSRQEGRIWKSLCSWRPRARQRSSVPRAAPGLCSSTLLIIESKTMIPEVPGVGRGCWEGDSHLWTSTEKVPEQLVHSQACGCLRPSGRHNQIKNGRLPGVPGTPGKRAPPAPTYRRG